LFIIYCTFFFFSGFRIVGVNNSKVMWFYSVQGVFRTIFEFGTKEMQRDCLGCLQVVTYRFYYYYFISH